MSKALIKQEPLTIEQMTALSHDLAKSTLLPPVMREKQANVMFAIMTGAELGLSPMASIRGIHVIEGKPTLSADTMLAVVRRSGAAEYIELVESTAERATYRTKRVGARQELVYTYTIEDAQKAGLIKKDSGYDKHPKNMLRARCSSMLLRIEYSDILAGLYATEELLAGEPEQTRPQAAPANDIADAEIIGETVEAGPVELDARAAVIIARMIDAKSVNDLARASADGMALKLDKKSPEHAAIKAAYDAANKRLTAQKEAA